MSDAYYCIGSICLARGTWADWFSGTAATAAVIVALFSMHIADFIRRKEARAGEIRTANLVGLKVFRTLNSTADIHRHVCAKHIVATPGFDGTPEIFRSIRPMINVEPDPTLQLDGAESTLLINIRQAGYLTDLYLAMSRLRSICLSMETYRELNESFHQMMPPPVAMDGGVSTFAVTREQAESLKLPSAQLEALIQQIREMTDENLAICNGLAERFHPMMKTAFPEAKFLKFEPPANEEDARASIRPDS